MRADRLVDIAVFARTPVPGQAKTRLIPRLGAEAAAQLQRQLMAQSIARARAVPGARVSLWTCGPLDEDTRDLARRSEIALREQRGADLGERMANAFESSLEDGRPMLLVGTDCPAQTVEDLRAAIDALGSADAVVQPAEDGGYVLIGMRRPLRALFRAIAWGTDTVLSTTRRRAAEHGLVLAEIAGRWDLDRDDDLDRALALGLVQLPGIS